MKSYKELLSNDPLQEAIQNVIEGRDYIVVHAKSTAGVDAHLAEDNTNDKSDDGEGLDKVQPKAVKKKFKDRKDKDIDNDGDVDDSDEYIHKKRKAISKAVANEDVDKADETPSGAEDDAEDEAPKKKKRKKDNGEKDTPSVKDTGGEVVDTEPKLDENYYTEKYGDRAQAVMERVAEKLSNK